MAVHKRSYTAEDLLALPRGKKRCELIESQLIEMDLNGAVHGLVCAEFAGLLTAYTRKAQAGRVYAATGFRLGSNPDTVLGIDVAFISMARLKPIQPGYIEGAPDLAAEVTSPDDTAKSIHDKVARFLRAGARLVWLIQPDARVVHAYSGTGDIILFEAQDTLTGGDVLPGFAIKVAEIFAVLDQ